MAEWKLSIKRLADDFCLSQIKINKMLKRIEEEYEQREREMPLFYKGNKDEYLYDIAQRQIRSLVLA